MTSEGGALPIIFIEWEPDAHDANVEVLRYNGMQQDAERLEQINSNIVYLVAAGNFEEAIHPAEDAIKIAKKVRIQPRQNAKFYQHGVVPYIERLYGLHLKVFGIGHIETANTLATLAGLYIESNQYRIKVIPLVEHARVVITGSGVDQRFPEAQFISSLMAAAQAHDAVQLQKEKININQDKNLKTLEATRKAHGLRSIQAAKKCYDIGELYFDYLRYSDAIGPFEEALSIAREKKIMNWSV
jgi:tetratricopeptide (TPR) repeat protein